MSEPALLTPGQLTIDYDAATAAAEAGQQEALGAERVKPWRELADDWLERQPRGLRFTADELVEAIGLPDKGVYRNNAVGGWFGNKSRIGTLVFTGRFVRSARVIGHGNLQRVWRVA